MAKRIVVVEEHLHDYDGTVEGCPGCFADPHDVTDAGEDGVTERPLRVLVACEMSGRVRDQFARRGWEAWSADLLESESVNWGWQAEGREGSANHYQGDVRDLFSYAHPVNQDVFEWRVLCREDGHLYPWDLIIAHPPCDHLSYAGARWFKAKQADGRQQKAADFFMDMIAAPSPLVCVENPHSIMQRLFEPANQVVQPWMFGDPKRKQIHLWLKGLPELYADCPVKPTGRVTTGGGSWRTDKGKSASDEDSEGRARRAIVRSRTSEGLARAMAAQWAPFAEEYYGVGTR